MGAGEDGCSAVLPGMGCWLYPPWLELGGDRSERPSISTEQEEHERRRDTHEHRDRWAPSQRCYAVLQLEGSTEKHEVPG